MGARIGLISDTHGLLRPQAIEALRGVDHILHLGDIGKPDIMTELATIAPVTAVRGNNDREDWAEEIPEQVELEFEGHRILLIHDLKELASDPSKNGIDVVLAGHSHRPSVKEEGCVLYVNPGSAGPRRFSLPISVGLLSIYSDAIKAEIVELAV